MGVVWPPFGFECVVVDYLSIPLLNSILLLSSGARVTWCHHYIVSSSLKGDNMSLFMVKFSLLFTIILGVWFLVMQVKEYSISDFSVKSLLYGSSFYLLTGFHGRHVTVGVILLSVSLVRSLVYHLRSGNHIGFEVSV